MRTYKEKRETKETSIDLAINLDGTGKTDIKTGIGFFDHMLEQIGKHSFSDLKIICKGDLNVDCHHSVEDVGIVLGRAIKNALSDMNGINRYGNAIIPMDEALVLCAIDIANRPFVDVYAVENFKIGLFDTEMVLEFFRAVAFNSGMNIHIKVLSGTNNHHVIEAMFKAFARAFFEAKTVNPRIVGITSTKELL